LKERTVRRKRGANLTGGNIDGAGSKFCVVARRTPDEGRCPSCLSLGNTCG
jgi:hypothetical protein